MNLRKMICIVLSLAMIVPSIGCAAGGAPASTGSAPAKEEAAEPAESGTASDSAEAEAAAEPAAEAAAEPSADNSDSYAAETEIPLEDISVTWEDSRVYSELTLGQYIVIRTYGVKGYEDVPFIKVTDYLDYLFEGKQKVSAENGVMKVSVNGTTAEIDPEKDTIRFENPAMLKSTGVVSGAIMEKWEYNTVSVSVKNESVETAVNPLVVSLKDYHMPVISYEEDILMPFLALQNTFGAACMTTVMAYNGKDYFDAFEATYFVSQPGHEDAANSPYMNLYNGPFHAKTQTTQAYADYGYYSICLLLDLTFGHKEEKNIRTFDEYFTRLNAKNYMCSTDPNAAVTAEFMLFNYLFDSAHDTVASVRNVFGTMEQVDTELVEDIADEIKESQEGKELFEEEKELKENEGGSPLDVIMGALFEKGFKIPEIIPYLVWSTYMSSTVPKEYGEQRLDFAGDTAVIYFTSFRDNTYERKPSYYLDPIKERDDADSSFAFFYHCFEEIRQHEEVKNVVINLSNNGGGAAAALISILGFLSEDGEVRITNRDMLAGNYREECYHVDTNLDGIPDDQDGFGGQYDFFIMCSGSSYSCGTALPYFAQQAGTAKIIGTNPGGGDCVVGYFIDAYGRCACYSSFLKLGKEEGGVFVSDEKATQLDLNMMPSILDIQQVPWYDPEGIAEAVHQYKNGVTEIVYDERDEFERLSDFLTELLERMAELEAENGGSGTN